MSTTRCCGPKIRMTSNRVDKGETQNMNLPTRFILYKSTVQELLTFVWPFWLVVISCFLQHFWIYSWLSLVRKSFEGYERWMQVRNYCIYIMIVIMKWNKIRAQKPLLLMLANYPLIRHIPYTCFTFFSHTAQIMGNKPNKKQTESECPKTNTLQLPVRVCVMPVSLYETKNILLSWSWFCHSAASFGWIVLQAAKICLDFELLKTKWVERMILAAKELHRQASAQQQAVPAKHVHGVLWHYNWLLRSYRKQRNQTTSYPACQIYG